MGHRRWPHFSTARGRAQLEVPGAVGADLEHLGTPGARWFGRVLLAAQLEVPGAVLRPANPPRRAALGEVKVAHLGAGLVQLGTRIAVGVVSIGWLRGRV